VLLEEMQGRIEIDELPDVEANETQMRQLFQNLINNGLKYRSTQKPLIRIYSNPSPENLFHEIHVEDNGIGFDELYLDKIFKPFQRGFMGGAHHIRGQEWGSLYAARFLNATEEALRPEVNRARDRHSS